MAGDPLPRPLIAAAGGLPGTPIRGESGCQAPLVNAPISASWWVENPKSEIRNPK